ncbi:MAG: nucleotidyltransferase domain-containing protein [Firmicutes bacterium]|nr:nucleotidyltransferase domain-containing protein [Bacillota bacterium]
MARQLAQVTEIASKTIRLLKDRIPIQSAYLFGSYTQGTADDDSDIDIAAFSPAIDNMDLETKIDLVARVQKEANAEVEIHLFPERCLKEARATNFYGYILSTGTEIKV